MDLQASSPAATAPHPPNVLFFNQRGLRPGWRLLIFTALFLAALALSSIVVALVFRLHPPVSSPGQSPLLLLVTEIASFASVVTATWVMSRIESRDMGEYGLPLRKTALSRFAMGYVIWGFLPMSALLLGLRALGSFEFGSVSLHGLEIIQWGAAWGGVFLMVGLFEEYLFRGYALTTLAEGIGYWPAAIVLAVVFALVHATNLGESRLGVVSAGVFAIFDSVVIWRTGNLWLAVGAHAGWDWGQSFFYGVSDSGLQVAGHLLNPRVHGPEWLSGGAVGPEGSVVTLVLLVGMAVVFAWLHPSPKGPTELATAASKNLRP